MRRRFELKFLLRLVGWSKDPGDKPLKAVIAEAGDNGLITLEQGWFLGSAYIVLSATAEDEEQVYVVAEQAAEPLHQMTAVGTILATIGNDISEEAAARAAHEGMGA